MRSLYATVLAAAAAVLAAPVVEKDLVTIQTAETRGDKYLQVDIAESAIEADGLLYHTDVSFKVEVVEGVALLNDDIAVPFGAARFEIDSQVHEYAITESGLRQLAAEDVRPVALHVGTNLHLDVAGHMQLQVQVWRVEGQDLDMAHIVAVDIALDDDLNEVARIVVGDAPVVSAEDAAAGADDGLQGVRDAWQAVRHALCNVECWFQAQAPAVRASLVVATVVGLALVAAMLVCCCRVCCGPSKRRVAEAKRRNYAKTIQTSAKVFTPIKKTAYKYTPLASKA